MRSLSLYILWCYGLFQQPHLPVVSYHGSCSQVPSTHHLSHDSARSVGLCTESDLRKERCDITRKALRLLCSTKVPAARHCGPPTNVVQSLHPFLRRASL